jgi:hypothetical protein
VRYNVCDKPPPGSLKKQSKSKLISQVTMPACLCVFQVPQQDVQNIYIPWCSRWILLGGTVGGWHYSQIPVQTSSWCLASIFCQGSESKVFFRAQMRCVGYRNEVCRLAYLMGTLAWEWPIIPQSQAASLNVWPLRDQFINFLEVEMSFWISKRRNYKTNACSL